MSSVNNGKLTIRYPASDPHELTTLKSVIVPYDHTNYMRQAVGSAPQIVGYVDGTIVLSGGSPHELTTLESVIVPNYMRQAVRLSGNKKY